MNLNKGIARELKWLLIVFIISLIILKIIFFKEGLFTIFKFDIALFWLFAMPGFLIMYLWKNELGFTERLIAGSALGVAIAGILSYYLGIIGIKDTSHIYIIPLFVILTACYMINKKTKTNKKIIN